MYSFGKQKPLCRLFISFLLPLIFFFLPAAGYSTDSAANPDTARETAAKNSNQAQQEQRRNPATQYADSADQSRLRLGSRVATWLESIGTEDEEENDMLSKFVGGFQALPSSFSTMFDRISPPGFSSSPLMLVITVAAIILFSLLMAKLFLNLIAKHYFSLDSSSIPTLGRAAKFISGFTRNIPNLLALLFFVLIAHVIFLLVLGATHPPLNLFFNGIILAICIFLTVKFLTQLFLSPSLAAFRVVPVNDRGALAIYRAVLVFTILFVATFYLVILFRGLSMGYEVGNAIKEIGATLLTLTSIWFVISYRQPVADYIRNSSQETGSTPWATEVLAKSWHMLTSFYFIFLWLLLLYDFVNSGYRSGKGAFIISFLIIPIWLIVNALGQWVTRNVFNTLGIYNLEPDTSSCATLSDEEAIKQEEGRLVLMKAKNFTRVAVTVILGLWLARLWNFYIPYISELTGVFFDTLLILIIALFFWKTLSGWIEKKIFASTEEEEEADDDPDSEWSGAAKRGRAYTLLPMLKKFIGSVLVVMVTLTILSSFGVDIGPLLAGAGVVGLAVGFGAQKLVSDVLSGFFFLLDDAFRVGEYIEAGGVSGSVEDITLRNVMLRHHRGMLQIVPHSELGAVTNFMRGGIIVKFNLDFPYDADIDLIRKIIKKVGQAMMEDEEFGKDFIRPVKSAGVREITNSVMTIRVKFTAQPGTHFVIRREAYKRITEALAKKGIHYAHRKVIVDLPHELIEAAKDGGSVKAQQALQAAGAAALSASETTEGGKTS